MAKAKSVNKSKKLKKMNKAEAAKAKAEKEARKVQAAALKARIRQQNQIAQIISSELELSPTSTIIALGDILELEFYGDTPITIEQLDRLRVIFQSHDIKVSARAEDYGYGGLCDYCSYSDIQARLVVTINNFKLLEEYA